MNTARAGEAQRIKFLLSLEFEPQKSCDNVWTWLVMCACKSSAREAEMGKQLPEACRPASL